MGLYGECECMHVKLTQCNYNKEPTHLLSSFHGFRYVPWNLHEEIKGQFKFEGILDIRYK